ncbi:MAG TPA: KamA family radical SAM protein [Spirochaetota bacterium]|nr:KamA family radical SAM protein [Spirochaetota bacterium]
MKKFYYPDYYFKNKERFFGKISEKDFDSYKWQLKNVINSKNQLLKLLPRLEGKIPDNLFERFSVTPYFFCLVDFDNFDNDPVAKQVIPDPRENVKLNYLKIDPFNEQNKSPEKQIIKRYPDRVLLVTTNFCPSYCRYCARKWNWQKSLSLTEDNMTEVLTYLKNNKQIREVIISGGEPLLLPVKFLEKIIGDILSVESVETVRIGTRIFSFLPQRIDKSILKMFKKYSPLWLVTHFNHSNEITPKTSEAVLRAIESGACIVNQSVLLKDINDTPEKMKRLVNDLQVIGVKPYYLFNCDLIEGTSHFRTGVEAGLKIMESLRGNTGGVCIPQFIIDLPEGGKVPILPEYLIEKNETSLKIRNYEGKIFDCPV